MKITDHQIRDLRKEALEVGDIKMMHICCIALGDSDADERALAEYGVARMMRDEASAECARVIARNAESPDRALPFGFSHIEDLALHFCACGHVVSRCDGSRRGCRTRLR